MIGSKVFVSCGQRTEKERSIAHEIRTRLNNEGYDSFLAIHTQGLEGLRELIFREIKSSDYFLFIDFCREEMIVEGNLAQFLFQRFTRHSKTYRGSLFCHQELAVAASLGLKSEEFLGFIQRGIKHPDGMSGMWSANYTLFDQPEDVIPMVVKAVKDKWNNQHRNSISVEVEIGATVDHGWQGVRGFTDGTLENSTFIQLPIRNKSLYKHAFNCSAYISRVKKLDSETNFSVISGELKWVGVLDTGINLYKQIIGHPPFQRLLNAVLIKDSNPSIGYVNTIGDNRDWDEPFFNGIGSYLIEYTIVSDNFPDVKSCFRLTLGTTKQEFKLTRISESNFESLSN